MLLLKIEIKSLKLYLKKHPFKVRWENSCKVQSKLTYFGEAVCWRLTLTFLSISRKLKTVNRPEKRK